MYNRSLWFNTYAWYNKLQITHLLFDHVCELKGASATFRSVGRGHANIIHNDYHIPVPNDVIIPIARMIIELIKETMQNYDKQV